ncbi:MAG: hypothetical protein CL608_33845 [Anaerolineaceae bacterium]|nr:hypothetical protein [Anaerolineaceae bacterium]
MKRNRLNATLLAFFLLFGLLACAEPTPAPGTNTPTTAAITEAEVEPTAPSTDSGQAVPTETDTPETAEPTIAPTDVPTHTPEGDPTEPATAVATEPISYTITVDSPQPNQAITVARDFTFSGSVSPVPSQRLEIELLASGTKNNGESLLAFVEVDATGSWTLTEAIHPRRTGPATLHIRVAGTDVAVPVTLRLAEDESSTIVTVNQPLTGEIAVAGQTLLISGESRNLIDGKIQVGLYGCPADTNENLEANIEFEAGNGPWRAQIILPETAAANCDTARLRVTTGGLTSNDPQVAWASDQFLTLVPPSDEQANIFTVWEPAQLRFTPGRTATLVGTAVNPVDGLVQVELVRDDVVLATATAVPDRFGYWETSLTPAASAETGEVQLRLSTGADETYRETVFPTRLGS